MSETNEPENPSTAVALRDDGNVEMVSQNGSGGLASLLSKRTPKSAIKTRPGPGDIKLKYIPWSYAVKRMNEAFGAGSWSRIIIKETAVNLDKGGGQEIIVQVRLPTPVGAYDAYGGGKYFSNNPNGSYADAAQIATSKATRRALALLGIGLDLYSPEDEEIRDSDPSDLNARAAFKSFCQVIGMNDKGALDILRTAYNIPTARNMGEIVSKVGELSGRGMTEPEVIWDLIFKLKTALES